MVQHLFDNIAVRKCIEPLGDFKDTFLFSRDMGIPSFLIFGDICLIILKDMGYFLKKLMGYGILGPPLPGPQYFASSLENLRRV